MADALISHPHVGSVWLENACIQDDRVVGEVGTGGGYLEPQYEVMNFPLSCVRKWDGKPSYCDRSAFCYCEGK